MDPMGMEFGKLRGEIWISQARTQVGGETFDNNDNNARSTDPKRGFIQ